MTANAAFTTCENSSLHAHPSPPASRDEALSWLLQYWRCRAADARAAVNASASAPVFSMIGHYLFDGNAAAVEGSAIIPGSEIGENINSIGLHLVKSRSSSQYPLSPTPPLLKPSAARLTTPTHHRPRRAARRASLARPSPSTFRRGFKASFSTTAPWPPGAQRRRPSAATRSRSSAAPTFQFSSRARLG